MRSSAALISESASCSLETKLSARSRKELSVPASLLILDSSPESSLEDFFKVSCERAVCSRFNFSYKSVSILWYFAHFFGTVLLAELALPEDEALSPKMSAKEAAPKFCGLTTAATLAIAAFFFTTGAVIFLISLRFCSKISITSSIVKLTSELRRERGLDFLLADLTIPLVLIAASLLALLAAEARLGLVFFLAEILFFTFSSVGSLVVSGTDFLATGFSVSVFFFTTFLVAVFFGAAFLFAAPLFLGVDFFAIDNFIKDLIARALLSSAVILRPTCLYAQARVPISNCADSDTRQHEMH